MPRKQMTLWQWFKSLDDPVPLDMAPRVMNVTYQKLRKSIQEGDLKLYRFKAGSGRIFEVVKLSDLQSLRKPRRIDANAQMALRRAFAALVGR